MGEVSLLVDGRVFVAKKSLLCEYSDYFRAMFSGAYVEGDLDEIKIDMIEAESMEILLRYMEMGFIDLSEFPLSKIGDVAFGANFLQITELIKQIEYTLDAQTSMSNWIETMNIAEAANYSKLEQNCAVFGLLSFKDMKPENVSTIYRLSWLLSHPYLNAPSELDVFKFGFNWITHMETGADALLIILGCLDFQRISEDDLGKIQALIKDYEHSLAAKVVDCVYDFAMEGKELSRINIINHRRVLCEKFTERVYQEVLSIVTASTERKLSFTPIIPMWVVKDTKPEVVPHCLYTFNKDKGFEKWLEVADKNLWGWSAVSWGPTKIVVLGGEYGRGTGNFMTDIRVYDILKKEWIQHGVKLPQRRHAGVVIVDDSLYIVGGVGGFRVMLDTSIVYDLNNRTHRNIARLPNIIQNPAVCVHNGTVLAAGHRNVYRYETYGQTDNWKLLLEIEIRCNFMTSFNGYIYCTQNYFNHLYRFKPDVDTKIEIITVLTNPPASICNLGDCLLVFTSMCGGSENLAVEEYDGISDKPRILWGVEDSDLMYNDVAGVCLIVMDLPKLNRPLTDYLKKYVMRYTDS